MPPEDLSEEPLSPTPQPTPEETVDVLGLPYTVEVIELEPDDEGAVSAHLVKRPCDHGPTTRAVLYVHGYADYFFHTEFAEWWTARGYDFYALDMRKYGRSLGAHQTPHLVKELSDHYPEIDEAWARITQRDHHTAVIATAHSTGGLTLSLWADDRDPDELAGLVLNSPFLEMPGPLWVRVPGTGVVNLVSKRRPLAALPRAAYSNYGRSLHVSQLGEWDYNIDWKPIQPRPMRVGWLAAVRRGQARLHQGLTLTCPILVLTSLKSGSPLDESQVHDSDVVLNVVQIRRWAAALGTHLTSIAIPGARHDVVLSLPEVRAAAYAALEQWHSAFISSTKTP